MKSIMSQNPCTTCTEDRQVGNPYTWQTPCHNCQKKLAWERARHDRIVALERIFGDDYDLDRLRELVEADRDGRCIILPKKFELCSVICQDKDGIYTHEVLGAIKKEGYKATLKGEKDV